MVAYIVRYDVSMEQMYAFVMPEEMRKIRIPEFARSKKRLEDGRSWHNRVHKDESFETCRIEGSEGKRHCHSDIMAHHDDRAGHR